MAASSFGVAAVISGIIYSQYVLSIKSSYDSGNNTLYAQPNSDQTIHHTEDTAEEETVVISQDTQASIQTVTLQEFLGKMYCTACPKHCSLLAPRCGSRQAQVQQAKVEYEKIYGTY